MSDLLLGLWRWGGWPGTESEIPEDDPGAVYGDVLMGVTIDDTSCLFDLGMPMPGEAPGTK